MNVFDQDLAEALDKTPCKVIVFGSRSWKCRSTIFHALAELPVRFDYLIHGAASGADSLAGTIGSRTRFAVQPYPAQWDLHGKAAGPIRNQQMLTENPDIELALCFRVGDTPGTRDMLQRVRKAGIEVRVFDAVPV